MSSAKGRPRSPETTARILRAALELLSQDGVDAITINAVAARSGVARATVYLRWPSREALIAAAARTAMGLPPLVRTGDLAVDIRAGAEQARAVFSQPAFLAVFPTLVRALLQPTDDMRLTYDALAPGRRLMAEEYVRLAATSGFRTDVDPELVMDLVMGALINRVLATGRPPTRAAAREVADIVIAGVRAGG